MAINSYGYGGAYLNESEWARLASMTGSPYGYSSPGAVAPYIASGFTLGFQNGSTSGGGVLDDFTSHTHTLPAQASWWCVCLRRSWGALGPKSEIVALQTGGVGVPSSRLSQPGVQDDQPLAFVQTSTTGIVSLMDARQHGSKDYFVRDIRAVHDPQLGAAYTLPDGSVYDTTLSSAGTVALKKRAVSDPWAGMQKPPRFGQSGMVQFSSNGLVTIRHSLGYRPMFFTFDYTANHTSTPLSLHTLHPPEFPDAITTETVTVKAKLSTTGADYAGRLANIYWVAFGGY